MVLEGLLKWGFISLFVGLFIAFSSGGLIIYLVKNNSETSDTVFWGAALQLMFIIGTILLILGFVFIIIDFSRNNNESMYPFNYGTAFPVHSEPGVLTEEVIGNLL